MADKHKEIDWPGPQLMVVIEPGPGARERLDAALGAARVAAVLIRPKRHQNLGGGEVKPLVDLAQAHGAAALLDDDVKLVATLGADGVHLSADGNVTARVADARARLGKAASIGVAVGHSRHLAMEAGEAGADYVAFGADAAGAAAVPGETDDGRPQTQHDLVAWWADIFEVPCVALDIAGHEEAARLAYAGADFVALDLPASAAVTDAARLVADVQDAIAEGA